MSATARMARVTLVIAMASALSLAACGGESSSGGAVAQPGIYPLVLIGLFLIIEGAVAIWAMYRKGGGSAGKAGNDGGNGDDGNDVSE